MKSASLLLLCALAACSPVDAGQSVAVPGQPGRLKSSATERATRRAYEHLGIAPPSGSSGSLF